MKMLLYALTLLSLFPARQSGAQENFFGEAEKRKSLQRLIFYGNVHGLGGGLHAAPLPWLGMDAMAGLQVPYSLLVSSPYLRNQLSANLRLRLMHPGGLYVAAGYFWGWYDAIQSTIDYKLEEHFAVQAPQLALGFAWPPQPVESQLLMEIGLVSGLPESVDVKAESEIAYYNILVRRARGLNANLFPFITILYQW